MQLKDPVCIMRLFELCCECPLKRPAPDYRTGCDSPCGRDRLDGTIFVPLFVVLPLLLLGGAASYFYLRRRMHRARRHAPDDVIDAEYTVIDRR